MALLEPPRLRPATSGPARDRAPDWVAGGTPQPLRHDLEALVGTDRVLARPIDLVRYSSDASPYRLLPKAVVMARDADDVAKVFAYARRESVPVTLRGAGTSLNGQGQGAGILVDVRQSFGGIEVLEEGAKVRVRPGTILGHVNRVLAPYGRKLGPDPASTDIATVGGVIANNSGGMRCGTTRDSYSTIRSLVLVLTSGTTVDTATPGAEERFAEAEPELAAELLAIRGEIIADEELTSRIRAKFEIKNTTGYRLCAFLDASTPVEILRRLVVGSEGTIAFVAEATFDTVPKPAKTTLAWLHFPDVPSAVAPVNDLVKAGATAVELMVAPALIAAGYSFPGAPEYFKEIDPASAALLVEFGGDDDVELDAKEKQASAIAGKGLIRPLEFTRDPERVELYWRIREGLHGLAGKLRLPGTALIVEDVCVPPARIAEATEDLRALLAAHGFLAGAAGHASAGNLHFMLTPDFAKPEDVERYEAFMEGLVDLILGKYDGSLKAEHGTGVNMAPFVEREWGAKATELMWRVKKAADPDGVLAPGVVLNRDPGCHLKNLRTTPPIEEEATACVECGFCEPVCPSRYLTTTPRQRIVIRREMARQAPGSPVYEALVADYEYDALETCAADGSCRLVCPVGIDTGKLVKGYRSEQHSDRAERVALALAKRWAAVERSARGGLRTGNAIAKVAGDAPVRGLSRATRQVLGRELVPEWGEAMPKAAAPDLPKTAREGAVAVYLPACINRMMGAPRGGGAGPSLPAALVKVSKRAGMPVWIPPDVAGTCCATPWSSKGFRRGQEWMARETVERLWRWSGEGALPVVIDASSCTLGLAAEVVDSLDDKGKSRHAKLQILDSVTWASRLLGNLEVSAKLGSIAVHPTCSTRHLGLAPELAKLAGELADSAVVPRTSTCCGFAGDRGFLHPELTASATVPEALELAGQSFDAYISTNRTCEIGMERATGERYRSAIEVLEEITRS